MIQICHMRRITTWKKDTHSKILALLHGWAMVSQGLYIFKNSFQFSSKHHLRVQPHRTLNLLRVINNTLERGICRTKCYIFG